MEQETYIISLLSKYLEESLTSDEEKDLQTWAALRPENKQLLARIRDPEILIADFKDYQQLWSGQSGPERETRIRQNIANKTHTDLVVSDKIIVFKRRWLSYAAAVLVLVTVGLITYQFYQPSSAGNNSVQIRYTDDVVPSSNQAFLTLEDGRQISLEGTKGHIILKDQHILYSDGDTLTQTNSGSAKQSFLTLTTPKGSMYQMTLSDGTEVWLNSASTLRYPRRFDGKARTVGLEGEGYFEVAPASQNQKAIPFFVRTKDQNVEVLGTQFVVSAYSDEPQVRTTLVEGSVQVHAGEKQLMLKPGEQSVLNGLQLVRKQVDPNVFLGWKDGYFHFDSQSIEVIMRQLARWYDVRIEYQGKKPEDTFNAVISRNKPLSEVLRLLEITDKVHFDIKERRVIVME